MKKIVFYSDCDFFAGCENMIAFFLNNNKANFPKYEFELIYKKSHHYKLGLDMRVNETSKTSEINLWGFSIYKRKKILKSLFFVMNIIFMPAIIIQNYFKILDALKKFKPDLLYLNNGGYPGSLSVRVASLAGKRLGIKTVMFVNNIPFSYKSLSRLIQYPFDLVIKNSVDLFITGSQSANNSLKEVLKISNSKRTQIFNAIDTSRFVINNKQNSKINTINFGVLGLHDARKGHIVLLRAIKDLKERKICSSNNFHLFIEGNGSTTNDLKNYVNLHKLNHEVTFMGHLKNINEFYNLINVLVVPSISNEDLPNVISESFAFKIPVIGTKLAGIPEQIINEKNGFLVDINDHIGIAKKMEIFINKPTIISDMGQIAYESYKKNFSTDAVAMKYNKFFTKLLGN